MSDVTLLYPNEQPCSLLLQTLRSNLALTHLFIILCFFLDRSGVYSEPNCNPEGIDKGVLAVGYGTLQGVDYWIVRNKYVFTKILKYGFDIAGTYLGHVATKPVFWVSYRVIFKPACSAT